MQMLTNPRKEKGYLMHSTMIEDRNQVAKTWIPSIISPLPCMSFQTQNKIKNRVRTLSFLQNLSYREFSQIHMDDRPSLAS